MPWIMSGIQAAGELQSLASNMSDWKKESIRSTPMKVDGATIDWVIIFWYLLVSQERGVVCFFGMEKWIFQVTLVWKETFRSSCTFRAVVTSRGSRLKRWTSSSPISVHFQALRRKNTNFAQILAPWTVFQCVFCRIWEKCQVSELPSLSWWFNNASVLSSFGFSTLETLPKVKVWWQCELLLYFFYLNCLHWHHQRSMFDLFIFKLVGDDWGKQCKKHVESASSRNFEGSSPSADVQQIHSNALLGSRHVAISTLEWTTNRYRTYMHKLKQIWQSNTICIFFVWETFKELVTKISAAALSVTERSRSRHSLLNRGPTTSRASTAKIPDNEKVTWVVNS